MAILVGTAANDILSITNGVSDSVGLFNGATLEEMKDGIADTIFGLGGNDNIRAGISNSTVYGGDGNDTLIPGFDNWGSVRCNLYGDAGNDILSDYSQEVNLYGGIGNDTLNAYGYGEAEGGAGVDHINGGGENGGTLSYRHSVSAVNINLAINTATGGDANGDIIRNFRNIYGSNFSDSLSGTAFKDFLLGLGGNDTISGALGDDYLDGGAGNDSMFGGLGNDSLNAGGGIDVIYGGDGSDTLFFANGANGARFNLTTNLGVGSAFGLQVFGVENIDGTDRDDILTGNAVSNKLRGNVGNDQLFGDGGNDDLQGDAGSDKLYGGAGNDVFRPGENADFIYGGDGNDTVSYVSYFAPSGVTVNLTAQAGTGGDAAGDVFVGIENVVGSTDNDTLIGSALANTLNGGDGQDTVSGGAGNDAVYGDNGTDMVLGNDGNDKLYGGNDSDTLYGGTGSDTLFGGSGADTLYGGEGVDVMAYDSGLIGVYVSLFNPNQNTGDAFGKVYTSIEGLAGGIGEDTLIGDSAANLLLGGEGSDFLNGYTGNDTQFGQGGEDLLYGEDGNDALFGGNGNDRIEGGAGNDLLIGDSGRDVLIGGLGRDVFLFRSVLDTGVDQATADAIVDFNAAAIDRIDLSILDAKLATALNDAFTFVAAGGFTGSGQVLVLQSGGNSYVAINNDGDLSADLMILLNGLITLDATDFIL